MTFRAMSLLPIVMSMPEDITPLCYHVLRVISRCTKEEMPRIHTWRIVALVTDKKAP